MVADNLQFQKLLTWIQGYDAHSLVNEADAEITFILKLFENLGYPAKCVYPKYPVDAYVSGKSGRKHEADLVFFSTEERRNQNADTSLVIVEAKHPNITDLEPHIKQVHFYGEILTPILLVVTNGHQLTVIKRRRFRRDEFVFNEPISFF